MKILRYVLIILFCVKIQPAVENLETGLFSCIKTLSDTNSTSKISIGGVLTLLSGVGALIITNLVLSPVNFSSIRYLVYTNNSSFEYVTKENASTVMDFSKPTRIFVHGWNKSPESKTSQILLKSYLSLGYNVIAVDWSAISKKSYLSGCLLSVPGIGKRLAGFIAAISANSSVFLQNTIVTGQSCGAHVAGQAGHHLQTMHGKKLPRITSLDAARPGYELLPLWRAVQKGDADFLFAMYTNPGLFGRKHIYGDFNVKFNRGDCQPQCMQNSNLIFAVSCSHLESIVYLAHLVVDPTFFAEKCSNGFDDCDPNNAVRVTEGINVTGNYFTNATLPLSLDDYY